MFDSPTITWDDPAWTFDGDLFEAESPFGPLSWAGVHVELGYYPAGTSFAKWDSARWDTEDEWADEPPWFDITCETMSVAISQGRDQPLDRFRTGTCTVEVNDPDGKFSPWSEITIEGTYATIRPGIDLRVWVDVLDEPDARRYRFTGVVDAIEDEWDASPSLDTAHRVTFQALDYLQDLAAYDGFEQAPTGAGEWTGERLGRILANAGYGRPRAFDKGTVTVQPTTLAKNALDECGLTVDTERGAFWCDRAGVLQFRDRNGLVNDSHYTSVQLVFGEDVADGETCYDDIKLASDATKIRNVVSVSREGGTAVTRTEDPSIALYRPRSYRRTDLIHEDDAESAVIAVEMLDQFAYADNRVESLTLDVTHPYTDAALLDLDVLHLIEVRRRTRSIQIVAELQIEQIVERITPTEWKIELGTFSAANIFDVARWDSDRWDTGLWGY